MSDLDERIANYCKSKKTVSQLYAASKAVAKKLMQANGEHERAAFALHYVVGRLPTGTLTTNPERTRYYEIVQVHQHAEPLRYFVKNIQRNTGKYGKGDYEARRARLAGSLLPVTDENDPVYVKWKRLKIVKTLEGDSHAEP